MTVRLPKLSAFLKFINCLLLVALVALLLFDVKGSSDQNGNKEIDVGHRSKRSSGQSQEAVLNGNGNPHRLSISGATYTRWGRTSCNGTGAELVYSGVAGGSWFDHHGGGSNYLCLPMDPLWSDFNVAVVNHAIVYGAEFELQANDFPFSGHSGKLQNHNVPCAVCRSTIHASVVMIPARNKCYEGWANEYSGYLMAGYHAHKGRTEFVCMDKHPETDPAGYRDENGVLFYSAEGACGSLPCPPYEAGKELTCVVCSM